MHVATSRSVLLLGLVAALAGCPAEPRADPERTADTAASLPDARQEFFRNIGYLCNRSFEGAAVFTLSDDQPQNGLVMIVESCTDREIRIPFHVDDDRSRTWVLTLTDEGLLFKHDHRHPDGTPEELTDYGGWATVDGTPNLQRFPADEETVAMVPEAATNVWTLSVDTESMRFVYDLQRHEQPRYRAAFDLSRPIQPPAD